MYAGWCLEVFIYCASAGGDLNDPYLHSLTCWDVLYIPRSLSEIPCNPSPNLWLPKTSQIHRQGGLEVLLSFTTVAKLKDCSYLEMAWSFSTTSLLFLNFQCLQILSIYHAPPENTTMKPTPMIFWKPEFFTSSSRNFPLFPASKFLCCWMGNIPCRYISQFRLLSSVQSSARSIVWYVSSYSSTSAVPRWDRFFSRCHTGRVEQREFD